MHDWIRYKLYTGADKHENQPVQSRTTGCPLCRAAPRRQLLQLSLDKWLVFNPARLNLAPFFHPFSRSPLRSLLSSWKGAKSSQSTTIARQKQLLPRPVTDFEAMVDSKQFTISSRKRRASRQNSVCKYWLPTFSSAAITRVLERKSISSIALAGATVKTS